VRAVSHLAGEKGVSVPLIDSLSVSNDHHIDEAVRLLEPFLGKRIGFLGVTFKSNTDDLRESPTLELMARLLDAGANVQAYDPNLHFGPHLQGQIDYVRHACPSQARLMDKLDGLALATADALIDASDVVVVSHATDEFRAAVAKRGKDVHVLDLVRLFPTRPDEATYQGIAW